MARYKATRCNVKSQILGIKSLHKILSHKYDQSHKVANAANKSNIVRYKVTNPTNKVTYEVANITNKVRLQDISHSVFTKY